MNYLTLKQSWKIQALNKKSVDKKRSTLHRAFNTQCVILLFRYTTNLAAVAKRLEFEEHRRIIDFSRSGAEAWS